MVGGEHQRQPASPPTAQRLLEPAEERAELVVQWQHGVGALGLVALNARDARYRRRSRWRTRTALRVQANG
jgi:hypothetical protein